MGFAAGLRAGSQSAQDAFNTYYSTKDRIKRDKQDAEVEAELAKLDPPKQGLSLPKVEFTADGAAPMQGVALADAPVGGEITSSPSAARAGLAAPRSASLSSSPTAESAQGFQVSPMALAPQTLAESERERIYGNVARIKGDIAGMRQADQNRRAFEYKETFSRFAKEFDSDDAGQVDLAIRQLNTTDGVVTIGDPDKKGYRELSYVDADGKGKFTKLSRAEQAQLYAAGQMMGSHPEESLAKIREINKELGDALARRNTSVIGVTGANNQVNNLRNDDTRGDEALAETKRSNAATEAYRNRQLASQERDRKDNADYRATQTQLARLGATRYERGQDGNTYALTPTMTPQGLKFERQKVNPDGVQFQKPFDPKEYAATVASLAEANGGNIKQAQIEADQLYGRGPGVQLENPTLRALDAQVAEDTKNPSHARGRPVSPALAPRPVNLAPVGRSEVAPSAPSVAPSGAKLLSRVSDGRYNVRMPNGTTALVTEDVALQMGLVEPPPPRRGFQLPSNVQNNFLTYGGMPGYNY